MTRKELRDYVDEQRTLNNIPYHVYSALIDGIDTLEQEQEPISETDIILTREEYGELVSSEYDNGYAKGYREALEQEPCEDAISRQATVDFLENHAETYEDVRVKMGFKVSASLINNRNNLPPVTPQDSRKGHWIYDNFNWRCSECNETPKTMGYVGTADFMTEHFKFCNHCGARMIEPQESEG